MKSKEFSIALILLTALPTILPIKCFAQDGFKEPGLYIVKAGKNKCKIEKWCPGYQENQINQAIIDEQHFLNKMMKNSGTRETTAKYSNKNQNMSKNGKREGGFCDYKIQKVPFDNAMKMKVNDLEILRTMPSSFYGMMVSCPVIIHDIDEQRPGFRLIVTDVTGKNSYNLPFYVSRFVDFSERKFILELMKVKKQPMIIKGMVNTFSKTNELQIDCREFYLIEN